MHTPDESAFRYDRDNHLMMIMDERRKEIVEKVSEKIGEDLAEAFIKLLVAAHDESMPEIDFFINDLKISEYDIACLKHDKQMCKEFILQDLEDERENQY